MLWHCILELMRAYGTTRTLVELSSTSFVVVGRTDEYDVTRLRAIAFARVAADVLHRRRG